MDDEGFEHSIFFEPISMDECLRMLLKNNPHAKETEIKEKLKWAVSLKKEDVRCLCGKKIWALGSALAGHPICYSCTTGKALPDDEYEIDEVCW